MTNQPSNLRQFFFENIALTSEQPIALEPKKAAGIYIWDINDRKYIDLIAGFNVANIGHNNLEVNEAIKKQVDLYTHLIVYGEFIESPQVEYAGLLIKQLPAHLNCVHFTNSGTEATEGAMKLAKRVTNRAGFISFKNAYHGSTQGSLSLMGDEYWKSAFRPLLPNIQVLKYNNFDDLIHIDENIAAVVMEVIQAESGITVADKAWIQQIRTLCTQKGVLLIIDEIQTGFGRTGTMFAFEQFGIEPDILLLGKALGGGMPLGAFIANKKKMHTLTNNPILGNISTFAGHPVSCAAGKKSLEILIRENYIQEIQEKENIFLTCLPHPIIKKITHAGLWFSVHFESQEIAFKIIHQCILNGLITDSFIFAPNCLRIAPSLAITKVEIQLVVKKLQQVFDQFI
ncbi:MAG: aspartate aminotransferase family protein [Sediminibacterium sp.]|nr:aspartate aminotransferase family protein [Sediminibacterium sp.]